jgi:hypothetical protein
VAGQGDLKDFTHLRHSSGVLSSRYALHSESFISVHAKEGGTGASPISTSSSSSPIVVRDGATALGTETDEKDTGSDEFRYPVRDLES